MEKAHQHPMVVNTGGAGPASRLIIKRHNRSTRAIRIKDDPSNIHYRWDNQLEPVARVREGDLVTFECRDGSDNQFSRTSTPEDVEKMDAERVHALTGPVYVEGAEPGDALEVEVINVHPRNDWGFTSLSKGNGLIFADPFASVLDDPDFQGPYFRVWDISGNFARMGKKKIKVPLAPFMGTMGVAPARRGVYRTFSPFEIGGNLDIRQLIKGSKIFFPVFNEGALFSVGDGHGAQGDGEVCVTAIEIAAEFSCRFRIHKNWNIPKPRAIIPPQHRTSLDDKGYYLTMGIDRDVKRATREAVRE